MKLPINNQVLQLELAKRKLKHFIKYTYPSYTSNWFTDYICDEIDVFLDQVINKESPRLMLFAPPRHGKSEIVSRRFPAYALGKYPNMSFIATSYASDLSNRNNRDVQRIIDEELYMNVFPNTKLSGKNVRTISQSTYLRNSDIFEVVDHKGVYRSAGVGGGITGMGGDVLIVDDPIKDFEQAESQVYRDKVFDWFTSTLYTRASSGGGILIILTRWHYDDLAGRLLENAKQPQGEQWKVISFPAISEKDEEKRKEGEALHEERFSLEALNKIKKAVGSRVWTSLYQQRPSLIEGTLFKRENWQYYKKLSNDAQTIKDQLGIKRTVQAWDTAFKKTDSADYSAGITLGITDNRYYILDLYKEKVEYPELKRSVQQYSDKWKPQVILVEDKASGQSLLQELKRQTKLPLLPYKVDKDKVARANSITPIHEAQLVYLPENDMWVADFIDSLSSFPNGVHDDDVDCFTMVLDYASRGTSGLYEWTRLLSNESTQGV